MYCARSNYFLVKLSVFPHKSWAICEKCIKGSKIGGKFFGPVTEKLLFSPSKAKFDKMAKIAIDSKCDFYVLSYETKFDFLGCTVWELQPLKQNPPPLPQVSLHGCSLRRTKNRRSKPSSYWNCPEGLGCKQNRYAELPECHSYEKILFLITNCPRLWWKNIIFTSHFLKIEFQDNSKIASE